MTEQPIYSGEGYANLESGDAYSGFIIVHDNWVTVLDGDDPVYTIPRRKIDFINWKSV